MKEFYFVYYLVLFGVYLLLPVVFWLWSRIPKKEVSRTEHHKKELRGHLVVSLLLSAIVLSFLPWPLTTMQEDHGADAFMAGMFVLVLIATAGFFIWMGVKQAGVNRRLLHEEQQKSHDSDQID